MLHIESSRGRSNTIHLQRNAASHTDVPSAKVATRQHAPTQTSNWPVPSGECRFGGNGIMQRACRLHFYSAKESGKLMTKRGLSICQACRRANKVGAKMTSGRCVEDLVGRCIAGFGIRVSFVLAGAPVTSGGWVPYWISRGM